MAEVHSLMEAEEDSNAEKKLKAVMEELSLSCGRYISIVKGGSNSLGKTKLDKERMKWCLKEIVRHQNNI